jgi:hypothetical protein
MVGRRASQSEGPRSNDYILQFRSRVGNYFYMCALEPREKNPSIENAITRRR